MLLLRPRPLNRQRRRRSPWRRLSRHWLSTGRPWRVWPRPATPPAGGRPAAAEPRLPPPSRPSCLLPSCRPPSAAGRLLRRCRPTAMPSSRSSSRRERTRTAFRVRGGAGRQRHRHGRTAVQSNGGAGSAAALADKAPPIASRVVSAGDCATGGREKYAPRRGHVGEGSVLRGGAHPAGNGGAGVARQAVEAATSSRRRPRRRRPRRWRRSLRRRHRRARRRRWLPRRLRRPLPKCRTSGLSRHMETYFQHFIHFTHHSPRGTLPS